MGYQRRQFQVAQKWPKRVKHARVPLRVVCCVDCQSPLSSTHAFELFGGRCRVCWLASVGSGPILFAEVG